MISLPLPLFTLPFPKKISPAGPTNLHAGYSCFDKKTGLWDRHMDYIPILLKEAYNKIEMKRLADKR